MTDYNLSKWLKDDLGLKHMSEADMNNLVYHPRHGSLCRRLIKFWTESTLCTRRYPNVFAREQCEEALGELQQKEELSRGLLLNLESQLRVNENTKNELKCSTERHACLVSIEDMLRTTTEALEDMVSRPNFALEQVGRLLDDPSYLGDISLETLYKSNQPNDPLDSLNTRPSTGMVTRREVASAKEEHEKLVTRAELMHHTISNVLATVTEAVEQSEADIKELRVENTNVEQLQALRVPDCQQVEVEADPEERQLRKQRERLVRELIECNQQVDGLAQQYTSSKLESNKSYKLQLEEDLALLGCLRQKEAMFKSMQGKEQQRKR